MNAEEIRDFAIGLPETEECFPFDEFTLVFKVAGKMFLLVALDEHPLRFNVKFSADRSIELRERYPQHVLPGYHMNKTYWNTIVGDGTFRPGDYHDFILESYRQVVSGFSRKKQEEILGLLEKHQSGDAR